MSYVTNLILSMGYEDADDDAGSPGMLPAVNAYFGTIGGLKRIPDDAWGGGKGPECRIYAGAFNHLSLDEFLAHLESLRWKQPDEVQVIVKEQDDDGFRIIGLAELTPNPGAAP